MPKEVRLPKKKELQENLNKANEYNSESNKAMMSVVDEQLKLVGLSGLDSVFLGLKHAEPPTKVLIAVLLALGLGGLAFGSILAFFMTLSFITVMLIGESNYYLLRETQKSVKKLLKANLDGEIAYMYLLKNNVLFTGEAKPKKKTTKKATKK